MKINIKDKKWKLSNCYLFLLIPGAFFFIIFLVFPLFWVVRVSFYENIPGGYMRAAWIFDNYKKFLGDFWYIQNVLFFSFKMAIGSSFFAIIFAYPIALYIVKSPGRMKKLLLTIVLSPLLISLVCLSLGLIIIFRGGGLLNQFLQWVGIISVPLRFMYTSKLVFLGLIYVSIPYMVLNLLDNLSRIDPCLEEAAMNAGANRWQCFFKIILPLSTPGMYAGSLIILSINFCAFAIPQMIGPDRIPMIGLFVYHHAMENYNIPFATSTAIITLLANLSILFVYQKVANNLFFKKLGV